MSIQLTTIAVMEAIRPPSAGGHYADDPNLLARAKQWLNSTSQWFQNQVGYSLSLATDTLLLSGKGVRLLPVPRPPIVQVISLTVAGTNWPVLDVGGAEACQFAMVEPETRAALVSRYWPWPQGWGNIQAQIICGYGTVDNTTNPATLTTVIPDDVQTAVALFATIGCLEATFAGLGGETIGAEHVAMLARNKKDYDSILDTVLYYRRMVMI